MVVELVLLLGLLLGLVLLVLLVEGIGFHGVSLLDQGSLAMEWTETRASTALSTAINGSQEMKIDGNANCGVDAKR
jgi:hypothetical protein